MTKAHPIATQHRVIDALLRSVRAAVGEADLPRARRSVAGLRRALAAHFALEEEHYFPRERRARPAREPEIEALLGEHEGLRARLVSVADGVDAADWEDAARDFDALEAAFHRHEQREHELFGA